MFFIAEIGVNHNGDTDLACKLIEEASKCGANAVKFQHFNAKKLAGPSTPKVQYQMRTSDPTETHQEMLKKLQITEEIERASIALCKKLNIEFISTPYDPESADHLIKLGCRYIKTASADIVDHRIHTVISKADIQPIIATGMATYEEIESVLEIYKYAVKKPILLHCVSNYPCSHESLNLRVIPEMAAKFNCEVGFSDHSIDEKAALASYVLGSRYFEKHFTLDKNAIGPDHSASSNPQELMFLISELHKLELMLGNPQKAVQDEETQMKEVSRKSIHTSKVIEKGAIFVDDNLTMIRPGGGLSGSFYQEILGKAATKNLPAGHQINLDDFE